MPQRGALKVLKFGSSVLRTPDDLAKVAGEIYRQHRAGYRILAVVSAFEGETDALIAACDTAAGSTDCAGHPDVISLGEEKAAFLLKIACDRIGLRAVVHRAETLGIVTEGDPLEADPVALDGQFRAVLASETVVIVPGYVGIDVSGSRSLLGRGGSDFSAIFLAGESGAECVRLYKDVNGVFDHDPAAGDSDLHRFKEVSWADCLTLAAPLLQPKAVEYAWRKQLTIEVGSIGSASPTIVSATTLPPAQVRSRPPLRVALAGFGTVGQALYERMRGENRFEVAAILVRDPAKKRRVPPPVELTKDVQGFAHHDCDVLVDLTCGEEAGTYLCGCQLTSARHVVSANKLVIGNGFSKLRGAAARFGGKLLYSATVGGGTPVLETLRAARAEGPVERITAILNGTVNFLLDQLARGAPFERALKLAQEAGFAEEDPAQDLSGQDAVLKLRIMAASALNVFGDDLKIDCEPLHQQLIDEISQSKERWVQLSSLRREGKQYVGSVRVVPATTVPLLSPPPGEGNAVVIEGADGRIWSATGRGAGGAATAEAVVADLYDLLAIREQREASQDDQAGLAVGEPCRGEAA